MLRRHSKNIDNIFIIIIIEILKKSEIEITEVNYFMFTRTV